jgi:sulfoxide reductase heme-binding subunit YedZ
MHVFWITSRAAGIAAVLFASLSVGLGLAMAARLVRGRLQDPRGLHEALSLATLAALAVHALSLLGDSFLSPSLADITIPFASGYHPVQMAIGIVSAYAMAILSLSYYARGRIGVTRWRAAHRLIAVAWLGGVLHGLLLGTDASRPWFLAAVGAVALPACALLAWRWIPEEEVHAA